MWVWKQAIPQSTLINNIFFLPSYFVKFFLTFDYFERSQRSRNKFYSIFLFLLRKNIHTIAGNESKV